MTVRQLLSGIDSLELSEWVAFFNLQAKGGENKKITLEEQFKSALRLRKKKRKI